MTFDQALHSSAIYDKCQTESANVLALPWEGPRQVDDNNTLATYLWISSQIPFTVDHKAYPCLY